MNQHLFYTLLCKKTFFSFLFFFICVLFDRYHLDGALVGETGLQSMYGQFDLSCCVKIIKAIVVYHARRSCQLSSKIFRLQPLLTTATAVSLVLLSASPMWIVAEPPKLSHWVVRALYQSLFKTASWCDCGKT